ncbi:hypothetical protein LCGC14_0837390 [marine sediment metagenome]|uniref:Uncharacterized protein n=1 Tax=marine sediment metagenome TaxID=412755 RepID=A0A0F9RYW2_9ZZZZ
MEETIEYPALAVCIVVIAEALEKPPLKVAPALLAQAKELGMSAEELIHRQYKTAVDIKGG